MKIEGTIKVGHQTWTFTCDSNQKERAAELVKDDIYQELHEANLDQCKGWEWSTKQSYKIMDKLDKAEITWKEI